MKDQGYKKKRLFAFQGWKSGNQTRLLFKSSCLVLNRVGLFMSTTSRGVQKLAGAMLVTGHNRPLMMSAKFFIPICSEWQLFGKQSRAFFGSTRPRAAGRDWLLYGERLGGMKLLFQERSVA